eukprot:g4134.t1
MATVNSDATPTITTPAAPACPRPSNSLTSPRSKALLEAALSPAAAPAAAAAPATVQTEKRGPAAATAAATHMFLSYPRGEETTPFALKLKAFLEAGGVDVWMDVEGIAGGADFMHAIGSAIQASQGVVAVINRKFCGSTYCNNELAMAQGNGLQLFPILFRDTTFDAMPAGLQYMLATTNVIMFPDEASDMENLAKMLDHIHTILRPPPPSKGPRRHGSAPSDAGAAGAGAGAGADAGLDPGGNAVSPLALIPATVPEPPDVVCERNDVMLKMLGDLLGFMGTGSVSLSSVKKQSVGTGAGPGKSKLSSHGQGGAGKTTMAAMVVRHQTVRRTFERIAWISIGQTPNVMEIQRTLHLQLTGTAMEDRPGSTAESQLKELQAACVGKRWLVVLDDVWDAAHEKLLNCIDSSTASKLFVTTRIRGLLKGCNEVALDLLSSDEAMDLLLRTGGIEPSDAACAAASRVAALCGNLPLFVGICGGIIADYEGDPAWQAELIDMLEKDRLNAVGAEDEGTVNRIVGTSLAMLKDATAETMFQMLGLCPEDARIPMEAVALIWSACLPEHAQKIAQPLAVRKLCKKLRDRNLLMGSTASGVHLHDIVRDFMRSKFGGDDIIREMQHRVIDAVTAAPGREDAWRDQPALSRYVRESLRQHMAEAVLPDAGADVRAQRWLDASTKLKTDVVVKTAANLFGGPLLEQLAAQHKAAGELEAAGRRSLSAAFSDDYEASIVKDQPDVRQKFKQLIFQGCDLLERCETQQENQPAIRVLLAITYGKLVCDLISDPDVPSIAAPKFVALIESGVELDGVSPDERARIGYSFVGLGMYGMGHTYMQAPFCPITWAPMFVDIGDGIDLFSDLVTHDFIAAVMDNYDFAQHHQRMCLFASGCDNPLCFNAAGTFALARFGNLPLFRRWIRKVVGVFESNDWRTIPTLALPVFVLPGTARSVLGEVGLGNEARKLLELGSWSFAESPATAQQLCGALCSAGAFWSEPDAG